MSKVLTPTFRVAFPNIFEARAYGDSKPKFSVTMLFNLEEIAKDPEQQKRWDALIASVDAAAIKKFGSVPAVYRKPFKKGDDSRNNETGAIYNGFEGMVVLNASSTTRPGLVDQERNPIISEEDFKGGYYAHATINFYGWQHPQSGKGVSCGLQNVQLVKEGEPFGGKSNAEDDFGVIAAPTANTTNSSLFDEA
jgi:hypothetical protein